MSKAAPRSAGLGDASARAIPRLLTKDELRELSRLDSKRFAAAVLIETATVVAAVAIPHIWWHPLLYILAVIVIGTRINALGGFMHEAAHYRGFANRSLNDFVGELVALPTSISMAGYRNTHFAHHRELNGENDPDWMKFADLPEYAFPASRTTMLGRIAFYLVGIKPFQAIGRVHGNKDVHDIATAVKSARLVFFLGLLAAAISFGFWKDILLYWIVPLFTVFIAVRYIRSVAEHFGVGHDSIFSETRTVLAPAWERWIFAPWGLNYHLEHHLFPSVPFYRLGDLHNLLMTREPFPQMAQITHGYLAGLFDELASAKPGSGETRVAA